MEAVAQISPHFEITNRHHSKDNGSVDLISTCVKIAFVKARLQSLDFYVESCSRNRKTETR